MEQQRRQEIEQLIRDYENRGEMTRKRFCESRGMTWSALDYYLRRYGKAKPSQNPPRLATVAITPAGTQVSASFRLVLGNGRSIECGPAELEHLIRVAEAV
jgi:hypothetical protein